ncbi:MAG: hypothetical protein KGI78_00825 [Patescibacteria group bacterium]|nr:hypothetical protein [Patescibacteria group bacterium]
MWLTHNGRRCVELNDRVFERLLTFYPEENLLTRKVPADALASGEISLSALKAEANRLFIPWQMFLLNMPRLRHHLRNIERNRRDKIRIAALSRRAGRVGAAPNRLIDRHIRAQNFLVSNGTYAPNAYNGMLRGMTAIDSVDAIVNHFSIDRDTFWRKSRKEEAFAYLVEIVQGGQVNVALGTSESRLVPSSANHKLLYKNVSGFCLKDEHVPFIFVNMNMADDEEPAGRRIYTLVYLLTLVGLGIYTLTRDWRPGRPISEADPYLKHAHVITSEFLLPTVDLDPYRGKPITPEIVMGLSGQYKLTPTAVLFRLWKEKLITKNERDTLIKPVPPRKSRGWPSYIDTAVRKFNGALVFGSVNAEFAARRITQNQAQYILFGRIRRTAWRQYRSRLRL